MQDSETKTVSKNIKTRPYTAEEMIHPPWSKVNISIIPDIEFDTHDYLHEDTMPIYMSLPRATWKIIFSMMEANKVTISEVFMKIVCDMVRAVYEMNQMARQEDKAGETKNIFSTAKPRNYAEEIDRVETLVKSFSKLFKEVEASKMKMKKEKPEV